MQSFRSRAIRTLSGAVVALHLGLTAIYNLPDNPARQSLAPVLQATIGRFFGQNWRLFAPNPASTNLSVLVACLDRPTFDDVEARQRDEAPLALDGRWADISEPLIRGHQGARLSAYDRLARAQINAARSVASMPLHLVLPARSCRKGDEAACTQVQAELSRWQDATHDYLARVASSYCLATAPDSVGLAMAVRERRALPWSARDDANAVPVVTDRLLGTFPVARDVIPAAIYAPAP